MIIGQTYLIEGKVSAYKGERQINVSSFRNVKPVNKKGIILYLQTLKGLKSKAYAIYDEFGKDSIQILMEDPMIVAKNIKGIGKKSVLSWKEQLDLMKESQYTIQSLLSYGITIKQAKKLYDKYGDSIVSNIEENPYMLTQMVRNYGFEKCDRIARNINYDPKSPFRIQECIIYILNEYSLNGNCYLYKEELIDETISFLNIKLNINEMKKYAKEKEGEIEFEYEYGDYKYLVNYNKMIDLINLYINEKNYKKRDKYRYVVLEFNKDEVNKELEVIERRKRIICDDDRVYLTDLYFAERDVAKRVCELIAETPFIKPINLKEELDNYCKANKIILEDKQKLAVLEMAQNDGGFFILCGNAGCGKTYTLKIILEMIKLQYRNIRKKFRVKVLAPTGKASKVASKSTGMECMTVHRGLGYNPSGGFEYDEYNQLEYDCVVVDESSMLDISLTRSLLVAIKNGTKVIFMGDTKQLPSIGPGNVLHDLINTNIVKVIMLDVVKRQGELSGIIRNANNIINVKMIENCNDTKDAYFVPRDTIEGAQRAIVESIRRILNWDDYNIEDVQLLCPQRNGLIGTIYMNYLLQKEFNPDTEGFTILNQKFQIRFNGYSEPTLIELYFKKGDKVIHIKNDYEMEWYKKDALSKYFKINQVGITNGECGIIEDIISTKIEGEKIKRIIVRYDDKYVFYDGVFDSLDHAYALTIHKSQGSSWKAIIMPIMKQNYIMLDNNLFYTGYTRAESFEVTIGQPDAVRYAINTFKTIKRYTYLTERIKEFINIKNK